MAIIVKYQGDAPLPTTIPVSIGAGTAAEPYPLNSSNGVSGVAAMLSANGVDQWGTWRTCTIVGDGSSGQVQVPWLASDFAASGSYVLYVRVYWNAGANWETLPPDVVQIPARTVNNAAPQSIAPTPPPDVTFRNLTITGTTTGITSTPAAGSVVDASVATGAAIAPTKIAGTAVITSDSRLSDARTPTAHAGTHGAAGSDPLGGLTAAQIASVGLAALPAQLLPDMATYLIYQNGGTVSARNGATGAIDYSGTDAATVINSAIAACPAYGTVALAPGIYLLTQPIIIDRANIALTGLGPMGGAVLQLANTFAVNAATVIQNSPTGLTAGTSTAAIIAGNTVNVVEVSLTNLYLLGSTYNNIGTLSGRLIDGIWLRGGSSEIRNCIVKQFPQDGIRLDSIDWNVTTIFDNLVENIYSRQNNRDQLFIGIRASDWEVSHCRFEGGKNLSNVTGRYGFYNEGGSGKVVLCHSYFNPQDGFLADRGSNLRYIACVSETNGRDGYRMALGGSSTYTGLSLVDCESYSNGASAEDVYFQKVTNGRIQGGYFQSNATQSINLINSSKCTITGAICTTAATGILADSASNYNQITGCYLQNPTTGVNVAGTHNKVTGGRIEGGVTVQVGASLNELKDVEILGTVSDSGSSTKIRNTSGYVVENSGAATVLQSTTSIAVTHGLSATPTRVQVTPTSSPGAFWWVSGLTSTQFTLNLSVANAGGNVTFNWRAQVGDG